MAITTLFEVALKENEVCVPQISENNNNNNNNGNTLLHPSRSSNDDNSNLSSDDGDGEVKATTKH